MCRHDVDRAGMPTCLAIAAYSGLQELRNRILGPTKWGSFIQTLFFLAISEDKCLPQILSHASILTGTRTCNEYIYYISIYVVALNGNKPSSFQFNLNQKKRHMSPSNTLLDHFFLCVLPP
jgi:hypothetical protein